MKILLAGFGGQGILFSGKFLAYIGLISEKQVSWLPSYGPEMRGGTANCNVIIQDEAIGSPIVSEPDILVALNLPSLQKYEGTVVAGGHIFYDSSLISKEILRTDINIHAIPATKLAEENKIKGLGNMIMAGCVIGLDTLLGFPVTQDIILEAMKKTVPPSKQALFDKNVKAVELGKA